MVFLLLHVFIFFIIFFNKIDMAIINCTVYVTIPERIPDRIMGTIAVANSSNEEIFWSHVQFEQTNRFPLNFIEVINNPSFPADNYTVQLHIYKLPRDSYDLPIWTGEKSMVLQRTEKHNKINIYVTRENDPLPPCLIGLIITTFAHQTNYLFDEVNVKIGNMPLITIPYDYGSCNRMFRVTNISAIEKKNSTRVFVSITGKYTILTMETIKYIDLTEDKECTTALFEVAPESKMNITITLYTHTLTYIDLLGQSVTYRIYRSDDLIFEQTEIIGKLEFPYLIQNTAVPINLADIYRIEASIFGTIKDIPSGVTLFQGVISSRLTPAVPNSVSISMLFTGPHVGTTIFGLLTCEPANASTWPLIGSNLAFSLSDSKNGIQKSYQFLIYDQTFPIQFTLLNIQEILADTHNISISVVITFLDATPMWSTVTQANFLYRKLNQFNITLTGLSDLTCKAPGSGYCTTALNQINDTCCSQYKCLNGACRLR